MCSVKWVFHSDFNLSMHKQVKLRVNEPSQRHQEILTILQIACSLSMFWIIMLRYWSSGPSIFELSLILSMRTNSASTWCSMKHLNIYHQSQIIENFINKIRTISWKRNFHNKIHTQKLTDLVYHRMLLSPQ